jgi:exodeoxyribonuclease III
VKNARHPDSIMKTILSWNVNGLRAVMKSGFLDWWRATRPDVLCLQETRVFPEDLPEELTRPEGGYSFWHPAKKPGYSGTGIVTYIEPIEVAAMEIPEFDDEGRLQAAVFPEFTILNGYWPNSQNERKRLDYKLAFCEAIGKLADNLVKKKHNVILCGDFNIAHTEIDLARPKENENNAGYYIEEREAMTRFLGLGYVDTFRHFCKEPGHYSWWSYRTRGRERNIGWRLDYHCVNKKFLPRVKRSWILSEVMGSDHCPVGIEVE